MLSKRIIHKIANVLSFAVLFTTLISIPAYAGNQNETSQTANTMARQVEKMDRGLVAVKTSNNVYLGWRLLATEEENVSFNIYRDGKKININPIKTSTNYVDTDGTEKSKYYVKSIVDGVEQEASNSVSVLNNQYLKIPLNKPAGGKSLDNTEYEYTANDCSVADLDGDGEYEIVLKWDPTNSKDNAQDGMTGNVLVDAYELDGTFMWRIDLGKNIRAGAHYTQFMVYDLDGDGKAEISMKTADGTVDGKGTVIGNPDADYRMNKGRANSDKGPISGRVLAGPEFLTVFEGMTGKELSTVDYNPSRGSEVPSEQKTMWGDDYGNRMDRFLACVAYLDGKTPSVVFGRGYYTRLTIAAWDFRDGKLTQRWFFDSNTPGNEKFAGQGNHNLSVGDVDNDSKDEIIYGSSAVDDNGKALYITGLGHGDAMHLGDLDPDRPGLEVAEVHEDSKGNKNIPEMEIHDAATGEILWSVPSIGKDNGRGLAANIDSNRKGDEFWSNVGGLYDAKGNLICDEKPNSTNFAIWWDGDLTRELFDHTFDSKTGIGIPKIEKWDYKNKKLDTLFTAEGTSTNNWTKGNPCLQADILGDWREELILRSLDSSELRIYTTTIPTNHRLYTLMSDPIYRLGVAWQNTAYNQPPHTSYYIGDDANASLPGDSNKAILPKDIIVMCNNSCRVLNNGKVETIDINNYMVTPISKDKTTYIPVRFIAEKVGAKVEWNEAAKTVGIELGKNKLQIVIDSKKISINGTEMELSAPVQMINNRTLVPVDMVNKILGKSVYEDQGGITIISDKEQKINTEDEKRILEQIYDAIK